MKEKLKKKHFPEYYRNRLLNQLHCYTISVCDMSVQNYIAKLEDLTFRCNVIITKFVWSLRFKIRRAMISGSNDLDTVEEAFDVASKIDLTFKRLVNAKARYFKLGIWAL